MKLDMNFLRLFGFMPVKEGRMISLSAIIMFTELPFGDVEIVTTTGDKFTFSAEEFEQLRIFSQEQIQKAGGGRIVRPH